jgi:hypothetical protein
MLSLSKHEKPAAPSEPAQDGDEWKLSSELEQDQPLSVETRDVTLRQAQGEDKLRTSC